MSMKTRSVTCTDTPRLLDPSSTTRPYSSHAYFVHAHSYLKTTPSHTPRPFIPQKPRLLIKHVHSYPKTTPTHTPHPFIPQKARQLIHHAHSHLKNHAYSYTTPIHTPKTTPSNTPRPFIPQKPRLLIHHAHSYPKTTPSHTPRPFIPQKSRPHSSTDAHRCLVEGD
ncbi:uncharacterized protein LOC119579106 [Penaeus monodon]|uniref:uncharacterized protein LOC119579106 n=1 Tax=Penaeus monodon TaxID=6687 RepID=UPI0018A6DA40|nr:uncharacterized protein LOC119579106 [Penaeus monodon]